MKPPKLSDLITLRPFPPVITGAHIRDLRAQPQSIQTLDFLSSYLAFDVRSSHALDEAMSGLARVSRGGAWWINGVYGAGKSHFLGVIALLCDGVGHREWTRVYPKYGAAIEGFVPRLTVSVALDDWAAARYGLEEIFWRELEKEWARRDLPELSIEREGSRAEVFAALQQALEAQNLRGLVVCFDELSLFLGGREHRALQEDAAFLQFLGQHATRAPLWVFAALQKSVEDIGPLESYSLAQIRDRFVTLSLSLAHLPLLIQTRLVEVRDARQLETWCQSSFDVLHEALPRLDFGPQEWGALFPFHPTTVALLEAVTGRFFSRTRSAALFCTHAAQNVEGASERVGADAIWDYFSAEIGTHPDLRGLAEVWESWSGCAHDLAPEHAPILRRVAKFLLVCKVAGQIPSVVQIANALQIGVGLGGDGNYEFTRQLLEKLRRGAPFLAVERGETGLQDRYTVDLGKRVGDLARRQVQSVAQGMASGDPRLAKVALQSAKGEPFPLGEIGTGRSFSVFWHHVARQIAVAVWDGAGAQTLANRVLATREWGARDEAFLLCLPPFGRDEFDLGEVARLLPDASSRAAFWVWKPRSPARDEWELCRETGAAKLAASDPQLQDNRRGRAILEHLEREAPARDHALAKVVARLFCEGEIALGNGASLDASELRRADNFAGWLEGVADFALPQLFGKWPRVAPRARVLTPSNADALCLEMLRQGEEAFFSPSLERLARHVAEPLGVARVKAARFQIAGGNAELKADFLRELGDGAPLSQLEAAFGKNEWGLPPESLAMLVCALLRAGEIVAFDARGQELSPAQIGLPLRRTVHLLRPAILPDAPTWARLASVARELWNGPGGAVSFEQVARFAGDLESWREETQRALEIARARSAQIRRALRHDNASWREFDGVCHALGAALGELPETGGMGEKLARAANFDAPTIGAAQREFRRFATALETRITAILGAHSMLFSPDLAVPANLAPSRAALLEGFAEGESLLFNDELLAQSQNWANDYTRQYGQWHNAQNDAARGLSLRRLAQSDAVRAVERLGLLKTRELSGAASLRAAIEDEQGKLCSRDGTLDRGAATCSSCGLQFGERLKLTDAREFEQLIQTALETFAVWLHEEGARAILQKRASPLLTWDGSGEALLPLLTPSALRDLEEAFAPRRRAVRSLANLNSVLQECSTRVAMETAFAQWLDTPENVADGDEIVVED